MRKISVILPSYNYEAFLPEAIESVLAQTYKNWELIVVDDGSSDSSAHVIEKYCRQYPAQIRLFFHEGRKNRGLIETYRLGFEKSSGDYLAFLEADDAWYPESLAVRAGILDQNEDVVLAYHALEMTGEESLVKVQKRKCRWEGIPRQEMINRPFYAFPDLLKCNFVLSFSAFMTRKESLDSGDFQAPHTAWFDWWLLSQLSLRGKFFYIPQACLKWRIHKNNFNQKYCSGIDEYRTSVQFKEDIFQSMKACAKNALKKDDLFKALDATIKKENIMRNLKWIYLAFKGFLKKILSKDDWERLKKLMKRDAAAEASVP